MLSEFLRGLGSGDIVRVGPPNQRKLGGLSLELTEVGYDGAGTHLPTPHCGSVGTDGRARSFHELHYGYSYFGFAWR